MEDHFSELIIPRKPRPADAVKKVLLIIATLIAAFFGLMVSPIFLIAFIILGFPDYFLFPRFNVEYEYAYVNGEIDVAAIFSKASRKHLDTITLENVECIAPVSSHHLDSYGVTYKVVDYTSGEADHKVYAIIKSGNDSKKYLLELDEAMLEDLRWRLPGKVFRD